MVQDNTNGYFEDEFGDEGDPELKAATEPECSEDPSVIEEMDVDCEFEFKSNGWWCITHNCSA